MMFRQPILLLAALFLLTTPLSLTANAKSCSGFLADLIYPKSYAKYETKFTPSIRTRFPEAAAIVDEFESRRPSKSLFIQEFTTANRRAPTFADYAYHIRDYLHKLSVDIDNLKTVDDDFARFLNRASDHIDESFNKLSRHEAQNELLYKAPFNPDSPMQNDEIAQFLLQYYGVMGELRAYVQLDNIVVSNLSFDPGFYKVDGFVSPLAARIQTLIEQKFKEISPSSINSLLQRYPHIFATRTRAGRYLTLPESIAHGHNFIKTKEIDFVVALPKGKMGFVEVKKRKGAITKLDLHSTKHGGKSIFDQQLEDKEILAFLGLDQEIELLFMPINGITDEAANDLRAIGVRILPVAGGR